MFWTPNILEQNQNQIFNPSTSSSPQSRLPVQCDTIAAGCLSTGAGKRRGGRAVRNLLVHLQGGWWSVIQVLSKLNPEAGAVHKAPSMLKWNESPWMSLAGYAAGARVKVNDQRYLQVLLRCNWKKERQREFFVSQVFCWEPGCWPC